MPLNHLDPSSAVKINDLRRKILENESKGLPAHHGITKEELAEALSHLRQNRMNAAASATKKKAAKKSKTPAPQIDLAALFNKS